MAEHYDIDKLFREAQESRAGTPPAEAWERINETLDVNATWTRLDKTLSAQAARRRKMGWGFSLGIAASLCIGGWFLLSHNSNALLVHEAHHELQRIPFSGNSTVAKTQVRTNGTVTPATLPKTAVVNGSPVAVNNPPRKRTRLNRQPVQQQESANGLQTAANNNAAVQQNPATNLGVTTATVEQSWVFIAARPAQLQFNGNENQLTAYDPAALDSSWFSTRLKHRFSLDVFSGLRYSYMQNLTTDVPDSVSANALAPYASDVSGVTRASLSPVGGIGAGFQLTPRVQLNTAFYLFAGSGQDYTNYEGGRAVSHQLRLEYSSLAVGGAFRICPKRMLINRRFYGTVNAGFAVSYLRAKSDKSDFYEIQQEQIAYRTTDATLYAGFQYNVPLFNRLQLTPAVQWNQGIVNVSRNDLSTLAVYRRIYNSSAEARIGLKYTF
jgi:hypothetical protein